MNSTIFKAIAFLLNGTSILIASVLDFAGWGMVFMGLCQFPFGGCFFWLWLKELADEYYYSRLETPPPTYLSTIVTQNGNSYYHWKDLTGEHSIRQEVGSE